MQKGAGACHYHRPGQISPWTAAEPSTKRKVGSGKSIFPPIASVREAERTGASSKDPRMRAPSLRIESLRCCVNRFIAIRVTRACPQPVVARHARAVHAHARTVPMDPPNGTEHRGMEAERFHHATLQIMIRVPTALRQSARRIAGELHKQESESRRASLGCCGVEQNPDMSCDNVTCERLIFAQFFQDGRCFLRSRGLLTLSRQLSRGKLFYRGARIFAAGETRLHSEAPYI